jgi:transcription elongation GreA/GreB family factor
MSDNFDPFDPVNAAMRHLHNQNLASAAEARAENQAKTIAEMRYAGNELARVLDDIAQSSQLDAIAKAVVIATIAKWNRAKTGQL